MNFEDGQYIETTDGSLKTRDPYDPLGQKQKAIGLLKRFTRKIFSDDSYEGGANESQTQDKSTRVAKGPPLVNYQTGSIFGGILTLGLGFIMIELFVMEMMTVYQTMQADFVDNIDVFNEDRRPPGELNFGRFNNSLYFVFGLVDFELDWDVMNNPYVEYKGFEFHHGK